MNGQLGELKSVEIHEVSSPTVASPALDYETFYRQNFRQVVGLGFVLCGDLGAAEDLTQDAFMDAHRKWARLVDYDDPAAWVKRAVANRSVSRKRKKASEDRAITRLRNRRPLPSIELRDHDPEVWAAVRKLPKRQAQVVALVYVNGCTVAQAADTLEIGFETAKTHLSRAKAALATALASAETSTS